MKKVLAVLVLAMFLGGITAPAFASDNISSTDISLFDDDPKKDKKSKEKSSDCDTEVAVKTSDCGDKASDCKTSSSDCASKCGDKGVVTEAKAGDCSTKTKKDCGK